MEDLNFIKDESELNDEVKLYENISPEKKNKAFFKNSIIRKSTDETAQRPQLPSESNNRFGWYGFKEYHGGVNYCAENIKNAYQNPDIMWRNKNYYDFNRKK